jgi:hypothetical protein
MSLIVASAAVMKTKHNLLFHKFSLGVILSLCSWDFTMRQRNVFHILHLWLLGIRRDISGISKIVLPIPQSDIGCAFKTESVVYPGSIMYP